MTQLFIHVGYPKTATTTFQKHVFPNHPEIDYLGKFIPSHRYRDERLYPAIDRLMTVGEVGYEGVVGLRELIDTYREQCSKQVMLISSESFVHVTAVDSGLVAQRLKAAFGPCKIIITIREQLDIIRSWYGMHGRFGEYLFLSKSETERVSTPLSIDEWLKYTHRSYDRNFLSTLHYHEIIQYYIRLFGRDNIGVFLYEEFTQDRVSYLKRLCDFLGVDHVTALQLVDGRHELPNLTRRQLFYVQFMSKLVPSFNFEQSSANSQGIIQRFLSDSPRAKIEISAKWIENLSLSYKEGNRALVDDLDLPLVRFGYCL